ncbi:DNA-3-methyladenine glycosylase I [Homoserinibacter sp. GY 40078]|uniref:DNA-3-methyladenine glycosylase I n=1 Tax=Homoserinibacter sp. GY 40078 TaxID=2603275 RepID=UPI0011CA7837|nr:DNA-3-methyladenine glycosylase I [Homoserinibacter sp. GY 40078]TXK17278.1 DNA-3-methyladenine glycosylase I [Homoserinibacter sp. GY 40078]
MIRENVLVGEDGRARCGWAGDDAEYRRYHDEEWGYPLHGDRPLFEKLSLEGFQAGLSWITILRRRPTFREAFRDFEIDAVADFDTADVQRLLADPGIIRNRAKVEATISNAQVTRLLIADDPGALDRLIWSYAPPPAASRPGSLAEIPAVTAEAAALSKALKKVGYRFVGPTTMYALMQSAGLVDDHVRGCWRAA